MPVELVPEAVSKALDRPWVHVTRVYDAQKQCHRGDLNLRQQPANIIICNPEVNIILLIQLSDDEHRHLQIFWFSQEITMGVVLI